MRKSGMDGLKALDVKERMMEYDLDDQDRYRRATACLKYGINGQSFEIAHKMDRGAPRSQRYRGGISRSIYEESMLDRASRDFEMYIIQPLRNRGVLKNLAVNCNGGSLTRYDGNHRNTTKRDSNGTSTLRTIGDGPGPHHQDGYPL